MFRRTDWLRLTTGAKQWSTRDYQSRNVFPEPDINQDDNTNENPNR